MRARPTAVGFLLVLAVAALAEATEQRFEPSPKVLAVLAALDGHDGPALWPGFDPRAEPVAIYDGTATFLFRHPSPPDVFEEVAGRPGVRVFPGKHPAMRWTSTADIGGLRTATTLLTIDPDATAERTAQLLLHETFHVYSKARHPSWRPNEMDRYSYPFDDEEVDRLLLLEETALARAVVATARQDVAAWAALALSARSQRRARLAPEHVAFEEALEMQEGTATHVERLAAGTENDTTRLVGTQPPDGVRWRFYETGAAMAAVLQRLDPSWKEKIEPTPEITMTALLTAALVTEDVVPARLAPSEADALRDRARTRAAELAAARTRLRQSFAARGVRLVVEVAAGGEPLRLARFDPTALEILGHGDVLHTFGLVLERPEGRIEVTNPRFVRNYRSPSYDGVLAVTATAGDHPLRDGVRRVEVAGFAAPPTVTRPDGAVRVQAEGLVVELAGATLTVSDDEILVRLGAPDA